MNLTPAQPNSSETPETDAFIGPDGDGARGCPDWVDFARALEKERNALRTELEQVKEQLAESKRHEDAMMGECGDKREEMDQLAKDNGYLHTQLQQSRAEVATLNGKLAAAEEVNRTWNARIDNATATNDQLHAQLTAAQKDAARLIKAGNALVEYMSPGPIPAEEPTEVDYLLGDWNAAIDAAIAAPAKADLHGPTA